MSRIELKNNYMLKSKRFLATIVSGIIFIIGVFFIKCDPIPLATGIGIILAPYLAAESYSPSEIINISQGKQSKT